MSERDKIKSLLKQGELYAKQSLLNQSIEAYEGALSIIREDKEIPNRDKLLDLVAGKLRNVKEMRKEVDLASEQPELTEAMQSLIQKRFSFSGNKETAAIEGALALAKFGQYEQALAEFRALLKRGVMPLVVARNIITCLMTYATPEAAIGQLKQWISLETLTKPQLKQIHTYLKNLLEKKGVEAELPPLVKTRPKEEEEEDMSIDISSINVQLVEGPLKGESVELDVSFQADNNVSVIIPADKKDLLASLKAGTRLDHLQCYSPIGFFSGQGTVLGRTVIQEGPKKGNYLLDIAIDAG
jgi:tetratricopeptide (TPR) repeat protein